MIPAFRAIAIAGLLAVLAVTTTACTPSSGALGTPATPLVSPGNSASTTPPDLAPATPTGAPTTTESPTGPASGSIEPSIAPSITTAPTALPTAGMTTIPTTSMTIRAYFMLGSFTGNPGLAPVLRTTPATKAVATAAMNALLAGPNATEMAASPAMYTSVPAGTRLLDLAIAGGVATVNLSGQFATAAASFQAGPATAQVVYTLTQFPTVTSVRVQVEGVARGGSVGRSDFQLVGILPAIFVDYPAWGAAAGNPAKVRGLANVFEATFRVQVLDAGGTVLADRQVMASCGTGCWGTFAATIPYSVPKAQYGTLRVFSLSAKDGAPVNVTEYRTWLTPAP